MFEKLLDYCSYLLYNYPNANECLSYLDDRVSRQSQKKHNFGYFPRIDELSILLSEIPENQLIDDKLLYVKSINTNIGVNKSYLSYFKDHPLIMSYKDCYGEIIGVVGRSLISDEERQELKISKYKNTPFKKGENLFGLDFAKDSIIKEDFVYVVEGQFDVIKSNENELNNIVALGCSDMTHYQLSLLLRYTKNIVLLLDNDDGGDKGRRKILSKLSEYANFSQAYLPNGYKDLYEFWCDNKKLELNGVP